MALPPVQSIPNDTAPDAASDVIASLDAIRYWSGGHARIPSGKACIPLLSHCVLELEFTRDFEPIRFKHIPYIKRMTAGRHNSYSVMNVGAKTQFRDTRPRSSLGVYVNPAWLGAKRRVILATRDFSLLESMLGSVGLHYSSGGKRKGNSHDLMLRLRPKPNQIRVFDIVWQDWRIVDFNNPVIVRSVIPTSILPYDDPNGVKDSTRQAIRDQHEIFRRLFLDEDTGFLVNTSDIDRLAYMDNRLHPNFRRREEMARRSVLIERENELREDRARKYRDLESQLRTYETAPGFTKEDALQRIRELHEQASAMGSESAEFSDFIRRLKEFGRGKGVADIDLNDL